MTDQKTQQLKKLQERNFNLQQDQLRYERELSKLERRNAVLSAQLQSAEKQLAAQKGELDTRGRREALQRLGWEIEAQTRLDNLKREAAIQQRRMELEIQTIQREYGLLEAEKDGLLLANESLQQQNDQLAEETDDLLIERDVLLRCKDGVDATTRRLLEDQAKMEARLAAQQSEYDRSSQLQAEQIIQLQASAAGLAALLKAYEEEYKQEAADKLKLQAEHVSLQRSHTDLAESMNVLWQNNADLLQEQQLLQEENEALKASLNKKKSGFFSRLFRTRKAKPTVEVKERTAEEGEKKGFWRWLQRK